MLARLARSVVVTLGQGPNRLFGTSSRASSLSEFLEQPLKEGEARVAGEDLC